MPDVFINRRQLLLSAVESVYGQDRQPSEASSYQAIRIIEPFNIDLGQEIIEQTGGLSTLGYSRPFATVRPVGITFRTFVQGAGGSYSATVKPPMGDLLRACACIETFASTGGTGGAPMYRYTPAGLVQSQCSQTLYAHVDGFEHKMLGCMGNVNLLYVAATPVVAEWNFRGVLSTEVATVRGNPVGLPVTTPPRWIGSGSVYMNSFQAVIENLNFSTNNRLLEQRASLALSGSGIFRVMVTERTPGGSMDPEMTNANSFDLINAWRSTSGAAIRLQVGDALGLRFTLTMSQAISKQLSRQDKEGLATFGIDFQSYERLGNDEFALDFD